MDSPFTSATRVAIEKMILDHTTTSKYGYFLSEDQLEKLVQTLSAFLATSRDLKARGDQFLQAKGSRTREREFR